MKKRNTKIDKKLFKLGFVKVQDTQSIMAYDRSFNSKKNRCKCRVEILHLPDDKHLLCIKPFNIKTIDGDTIITRHNVYGLTYKEMKLFTKKMKEMHWD